MPELTLESLAARVEVLEQRVAEQTTAAMDKPKVLIRPGVGTWEAAFEAIRGIVDYDFDAAHAQNACDWKEAEERNR